MGVAVLLLAGSLFLIKPIGVSFLPSQEEKNVTLTFSPKAGQTLEDVKALGLKAEKFILAQKHLDKMQYSIGGSSRSEWAQAIQACSMSRMTATRLISIP